MELASTFCFPGGDSASEITAEELFKIYPLIAEGEDHELSLKLERLFDLMDSEKPDSVTIRLARESFLSHMRTSLKNRESSK